MQLQYYRYYFNSVEHDRQIEEINVSIAGNYVYIRKYNIKNLN